MGRSERQRRFKAVRGQLLESGRKRARWGEWRPPSPEGSSASWPPAAPTPPPQGNDAGHSPSWATSCANTACEEERRKVGCRPPPPAAAVPGERGRGVPGVRAGLEPPAPAPPRAPNVQQERTRTPQAGGSSWPQALGSARAEPRGSVRRRGTLRGPPGEGQGDTPRVREKNRGPPEAEKEPRVPSAVRDD